MASLTKKYKFAVIATDLVMLTVLDNQLMVLLIKMKKAPYGNGYWAAPGGLIRPDESVDQAASRTLKEKAGIGGVYLEQLYTFGRVDRDPFGRVVSVAYFALIPSSQVRPKTVAEYGGIKWFPVNKLPKLAYDHSEVIRLAVERLKAKLSYTNIAYSLLPKEFSLAELQKIYEVILARPLDKRNFRKKLFSLGLLRKTGKRRQGQANRPAELYAFKQRSAMVIKLL